MAIEKMSQMTIEGSTEHLEAVLMECCDSGSFQMIRNMSLKSSGEQNPYSSVYAKMRDIAASLEITPKRCDFKGVGYDSAEEFAQYADELGKRYSEIKADYDRVIKSLEEHTRTEAYVRHLLALNVSFKDLAELKYVKARIGRMPAGNEDKIKNFAEKCFVYLTLERNNDYVYGIYMVPSSLAEFVDFYMNSLMFERTQLPEYLCDNAEDADKKLEEQICAEQADKARLEYELDVFKKEFQGDIGAVMCKLKYKADCFELRRLALVSGEHFSFSGYCPTDKSVELRLKMKSISKDIKCVEVPLKRKSASADTPVRLKNNRFVRPFEMFVKMYGLPAYTGFDPTPYVAWTYMILFGLMFGDVGQGLVVSLLGLLLTRLTRNGLAPIMTRLGIFSMLGGCIYGSVFGIETIITPIYHRENIWQGVCRLFSGLGVPEHPESIFQAATVVLLFSLAIGIVLILISMFFNMTANFKSKNTGKALFEVNGLAGIIFYISLVAGVVGQLLFGIPMFSPAYIICLIVLPIMLIFFKEPLSVLVSGGKVEKPESIGNFIIENFIELFESAISFLSNTMSYLRVGGFVLSHAGFMLVVSQLAGTTVPGAEITVGTVITYVIGNILVMGIEGLLVGIQALRLEFYEIFSRFYDGSGKGFTPVEVKLDAEI